MRSKSLVLGLVLSTLVFGGCKSGSDEAGLANPASVYCEEQSYTLELRTDADGGQYGVCVFSDGTECEEWAFYRGECKPGMEEAQITKVPAEPPPGAPVETPDVVYQGISFSCDDALASDVVAETMLAVGPEDVAEWEVEPEHFRFSFTGYVLPDTFHEPRILVYPVSGFEAVSESAGRIIAALRQLLVDRPQTPAAIPFLPLFNAAQMMRCQVAYVDFPSGAGVRFLTQFGQDYRPINSHDMFYTFQGLTSDGSYYVAAILPVSHPSLPAAVVEEPGEDFRNNFESYRQGVEQQLNAQDASSFLPNLTLLDEMIQSLEVTPGSAPAAVASPVAEQDSYPGWASYVNTDYGFAFRYPTTWALEEVPAWVEEGRGTWVNSVKLTQGTLRLIVQYKRSTEDVLVGPSGLPAGQYEDRGTVTFMGQALPRRVLVFEGKDKMMMTGGEVGEMMFVIYLESDPEAGVDYEVVEIPEAVQAEVERILGSFE